MLIVDISLHIPIPLFKLRVSLQWLSKLRQLQSPQSCRFSVGVSSYPLAKEPSSEAWGQLTHGWGMVSGCSDMSMDPRSSHVKSVQHTWCPWVLNPSFPSHRMAANPVYLRMCGCLEEPLFSNFEPNVRCLHPSATGPHDNL